MSANCWCVLGCRTCLLFVWFVAWQIAACRRQARIQATCFAAGGAASFQVRGVSGGERKRVTSGEMLVGNQRVLCMDEISTGLDSAILYSIIRFLKQSVSALHSTTLISLLQPPPEVMGLFDDIIVLTEG